MPKIQVNGQKQQTSTFKSRIKQRFIKEIKRVIERYQLKKLVLVLDIRTAKVISNLFKVTQLVQYGIIFIENLEVVRKKIDEHAIYFISPQENSINYLLKDFQNQNEPQYHKIHILFSSSIRKQLLKKIAECKSLLKKIAKYSIKQFYFDLRLLSDDCISFDIPYLAEAFSSSKIEQQIKRGQIARKFIDLIANYSQICTIRLYYGESVSKVSQRMALRIEKQIRGYLRLLIDNKSSAISSKGRDITIFIADRSIDVISPILHTYNYEALLFDLQNVSLEQIEEGDKKSIAYDSILDDIYEDIRNRHISYGMIKVPQILDQVKQKIQTTLKTDPTQIKKLKEQYKSLNKHIQLLYDIKTKFQQKKLDQIGEIQLSLATGITKEGKQTSSSQFFNQIILIIKTTLTITREEKLRLAILTLSCIKLTKKDYQTLIGLFQDTDQKILKNVIAFGIKYDSKIARSTKSIQNSIMERAKMKLKQKQLTSERYTSALQIILPRFIQFQKIERNQSQKKFMEEIVISILQEKQGIPYRFDESRFVCFMSCGLSYSEICSLRQHQKLKKIVLATDSVMNPAQFIKQLSLINILEKQIDE